MVFKREIKRVRNPNVENSLEPQSIMSVFILLHLLPDASDCRFGKSYVIKLLEMVNSFFVRVVSCIVPNFSSQ